MAPPLERTEPSRSTRRARRMQRLSAFVRAASVCLALWIGCFDGGPAFAGDGGYERYRQRARLLALMRDQAGLGALLTKRRRDLHRLFVDAEREFLGKARVRSTTPRDVYLAIGRSAESALGITFYRRRAERVIASGGARIVRVWRGIPAPGDPESNALVAVEHARDAVTRVPPRRLPPGLLGAIRRLHEAGCRDGALAGLISLGIWHFEAAAFGEARRALERAVRLDRAINGGRAAEIAIKCGELGLKREDFEGAREWFKTAVERGDGDEVPLARAYLAQTHAYRFDVKLAREASARVRDALGSIHASVRPIVQFLLAEADFLLGEFDRALAFNQSAIKQFEASGRGRRALLARRQRAWIYMFIGRFEEAQKLLEKGLWEAKAKKDRFERIYHLRYLADLMSRQGKEGETLRYGLQMLNEAKQVGAPKEVVQALRFLGLVNQRCKLLDEARWYLKEGHELAEKLEVVGWTQDFARTLVQVLDELGLSDEARRYEQSLRANLEQSGSLTRVKDLLLLARSTRARGEEAQARADLAHATRLLDTMPTGTGDPWVLWLRGRAELESAAQSTDPEEVIECLVEAERYGVALKNPILRAAAMVRRASALKRVGRAAEAKVVLTQAVEMADSMLHGIGDPQLRGGWMSDASRRFIAQLADVAIELQDQKAERSDAGQLLHLAELLRDHAYRTWSISPDPATERERRTLRARIEEKLKQAEAPARLGQGGRRTLYRQLIDLRNEYEKLTNRIYLKDRKERGNSIDVARLRTALGDALLLEYLIGEDHAFLICVGRKEGVRVFRLAVDARRLEGRGQFFDTAIQRLRVGSEQRYAKWAKRFFDDLVRPVVDAGLAPPGRPLIIAPDRAVERLPFHALVTDAPAAGASYGDLAYLARRNPVRYVTAARDLLRDMPPSKPSRILAVAPAAAVTGLPGATREVKAVADLFAPRVVDLALGDDAAETAIRSRDDLGSFGVLHFATHGVFSALRADLSGLVLGPATDADDGILRGYEILDLDIAPRLVVLSACASGRDIADWGVSGVGWGRVFLQTGAGAVVLTSWPVDDAVAPSFMDHFYRALISGKASDASVTEAYRALITRPDHAYWSNPRYWAPFFLVGGAPRLEFVR